MGEREHGSQTPGRVPWYSRLRFWHLPAALGVLGAGLVLLLSVCPQCIPTSSPPTTVDPAATRPSLDWFSYLATAGGPLTDLCREEFDGDLVRCYDSLDRSTEDFEGLLADYALFLMGNPGLPPCGTGVSGECVDLDGRICSGADLLWDDEDRALVCER